MSHSSPESTPTEDGCAEKGSPAAFTVRALREEMGLTQLEFGTLIGLANKASVSLLESGKVAASLPVALEIERLSAGRIDAAALCEAVRLARAACGGGCGGEAVHGADHAPDGEAIQ